MNKPNDGGPAFPGYMMGGITGNMIPVPGMSLRDWFAGIALQGFVANKGSLYTSKENKLITAQEMYAYADVMLYTRE